MPRSSQNHVVSEMERWCNEDVDATDTEITKTRTESGARRIECKIENPDSEVFVAVDDNDNGKVLYSDENRESPQRVGFEQDWEGDVEDVDLHSDGFTMVSQKSTFSFTWK